MNRRGFLAGILAGTAAPSIVRSESLMRLWVPPQGVWHRGGLVSSPYKFESILGRRMQEIHAFEVAQQQILMTMCAALAIPYENLVRVNSSVPFRDVADRGEFIQPGRTK